MRKSVIFGSLLAIFLIMMLPAVSAEESKIVQSARTSPFFKNQEAYLETIRAKYANDPIPQTIIITLLIMFLKLIRAGMLLIDAVILFIIFKIIGGGQNNTTGLAI
jgi:hypothetical protein